MTNEHQPKEETRAYFAQKANEVQDMMGWDCNRGMVHSPATSVWIGFQEGYGDKPGFDLFNLLVDIPGHCKGSTVTAYALRKAGLEVPHHVEGRK